jgi:hypothetical protein
MKDKKLSVVLICMTILFFPSQAKAAGVAARRQQMMQQQQAAYQQAMRQAAGQQQAQQGSSLSGSSPQPQSVQRGNGPRTFLRVEDHPAFSSDNPYDHSFDQPSLRRDQPSGPSSQTGYDNVFESSSPDDNGATLKDLWNQLDRSSEVWAQIVDREPKEMTIKRYIELFSQQGVNIRKSVEYYVDMIDSMTKESPQMLQSPFRDILRVVAILEYDFDNGADRELLVRQVLGNQGYQRNLQRVRQNNSRVVY